VYNLSINLCFSWIAHKDWSPRGILLAVPLKFPCICAPLYTFLLMCRVWALKQLRSVLRYKFSAILHRLSEEYECPSDAINK
jgi:hypothetical protein